MRNVLHLLVFWLIFISVFFTCFTSAAQCSRHNDSLELVKLYNATDGPNWTNKWDLKKPMSEWWGVKLNYVGCVEGIRLNENKLIGELPEMKFPNLILLYLSNNQLTGEIPNIDAPIIQSLAMSNNHLTGNIPDFKSKCLIEIGLGNNKLTGEIPNFESECLLLLDLQNNKLTGLIPNFKSSHLAGIDLSNNRIYGDVPNFSNTQGEMLYLILSNNQLSGNVPNFSSNISTIDLSNNRLTGYIPNFTHLDVGNLDVSRDEIDGIDAKFNLPVMNIKLNYNKISKIPIFISVPDAIFIHDTLILNNNNLTFEYLLPNLSMIKRMGSRAPYAPQDSIFRDTSIFLFVGDSLSIDLKIDSQINTNRYQWFKDGQPYGQVNNSNKLVIRNFQPRDEGTYRVQVTNPALPALTLHSKAIRLKADLSNSAFEFFPSFTPNGDGINETFVIRAKKLNLCPSGKLIECYPNNELLIYNRNGELIARKQGYQNDWNAAGQPAGNYHYIFYRDRIDRKKADRGIITILK